MSLDPQPIISMYSYTEEEQSTFPYLRRYMEMIAPHLPDIVKDPLKLERFMLAGLFLTYRAYNHAGKPMTTEPSTLFGDDIHRKRLLTYKEMTGKDVQNAQDYLARIHFGLLKVLSRNQARNLYRFVLHGQ
ncbi:MAG: hypothetical protein IPP13_07420 [Kouleothrix sp.]|jgi:hypothetical protein|nr:hypothetical protein [Kouleothrix sp.]